jgi:hypothetical protein
MFFIGQFEGHLLRDGLLNQGPKGPPAALDRTRRRHGTQSRWQADNLMREEVEAMARSAGAILIFLLEGDTLL